MPTPEDRALRIRALNRSVIEEFERKAQDGAVSETWIDEADQAEIPLAGGDITEGPGPGR